MSKKFDDSTKNSIGRLIIVGLIVLAEISWLMFMLFYFNQMNAWVSALTNLLAVLLVLEIVSKHTNSAFKLSWVVLILISPFVGLVFYLIAGRSALTKKKQEKLECIGSLLRSRYLEDASHKAEGKAPYYSQMRYIRDDSGYPAYSDTDVEFCGDTSIILEELLDALSKAEKFIFMEYHAIEDKEAFGRIKAVLSERASKGVEVRVIYDDLGSVGFLSPVFTKKLEKLGIQCRVFNPIVPFISVFMNNRDHRKITVIDGNIGFTGGYNLADEYFNIVNPYGEWKDSGLKLQGNAVKSLTVQFLEMWNTIKDTDTEFDRYFPDTDACRDAYGYIQPYGDCPLDDIYLGENVYMNMINGAEKYIWFMTPYLIINDEMRRALTLASKKGVDVRIITPGIPDKKFVYRLTRSYYHQLVKNGVRIYEFTPGFLHSKQCICDDRTAVVGTINLDYRSLYFHFENAVFFADCAAVSDVKADFDRTFPRCCEVTEKYRRDYTGIKRIYNRVLRLIAPLM